MPIVHHAMVDCSYQLAADTLIVGQGHGRKLTPHVLGPDLVLPQALIAESEFRSVRPGSLPSPGGSRHLVDLAMLPFMPQLTAVLG